MRKSRSSFKCAARDPERWRSSLQARVDDSCRRNLVSTHALTGLPSCDGYGRLYGPLSTFTTTVATTLGSTCGYFCSCATTTTFLTRRMCST